MIDGQTMTIYKIGGMTCQSCATRLEKILNKKPNIQTASVNFATETLTINTQDGCDIDENTLADWVSKAGFWLEQDSQDSQNFGFWQGFLKNNRVLTLIFVVFLVNMLAMFASYDHLLPVSVQFVLASVVQFFVARHFYQSAWASIKGRLANMDVLVVIGTLSIWAYSTYAFVNDMTHHTHIYFEASVMVIFFISFGKYIENYTKRISLDSVSLMLSLVPEFVKIRTTEGYKNIATNKVKVGDILLVKQNDYVAIDGVVILGDGVCDESHLTGESMPAHKRLGDNVYAGAWVTGGTFEYRTTTYSKTSMLADLTRKLANAQGTKASVARIADRATSVFVPIVIGVSLLAFLANWWFLDDIGQALMAAVSVLVIACPCALGLATPAAIMAGTGVAARHGVWFKDAKTLELSGNINTVVLDKTGTLTVGHPKIVAKSMLDGKLSTKEALAVAASLQEYANHPLAGCFVEDAKSQNLSLYGVKSPQNHLGQGITGNVLGVGQVKIGTMAFVGYPSQAVPTDGVWSIASIVAMSIDDKPVAVYALADDIKPDALAVIDRLKADGLELIVMSGDKQSVVSYVAGKLGVAKALGEMLPQDKARAIQGLKQNPQACVVMVGDGINDALAMSVADSSFSVGAATAVAKHTADAWLMGDSLSGIFYAKKISEKTLANIHQNLFFAFVYNIIGIGLAIFGMLTPMIAAIAMTASSILVVLNALRLKRLDLTDQL